MAETSADWTQWVWSHERARDVIEAYAHLLDVAQQGTTPNYALCVILSRMVPENDTLAEIGYQMEMTMVAETPPPIAGIRARTAHSAIYELAERTLDSLVEAAGAFVPYSDWHAIPPGSASYGGPPQLKTWQALIDLLKATKDRQLAAKMLSRVNLVDLDSDAVLQMLDVEALRAEKAVKQGAGQAGQTAGNPASIPAATAPAEQGGNGANAKATSDAEWPADTDNKAALSPSDIADKAGVGREALRKRLERWRQNNPAGVGKDWFEVHDKPSRGAAYLFRIGAVRHIIAALKASGERPAKKFS